MSTHLFQVNTLAAGVGTSENLHEAILTVIQRVVGNKRRHTQFLQRMPVTRKTTSGQRGNQWTETATKKLPRLVSREDE